MSVATVKKLRNKQDLVDAILDGTGILDDPRINTDPEMLRATYSSIISAPKPRSKNKNSESVQIESDPYEFQDVLRDETHEQTPVCPLSLDEKLVFIDTFRSWTGMEYDEHTEEEMIEELNNVRAFLKNDMTKLLGLSGVIADIHSCIFLLELDRFDEDELMAYAIMFHVDMAILEDLQDAMQESYSSYALASNVSESELEALQKSNLEKYMKTLKTAIIHHKLWMMDRLRRWKWIEEILFGRAGNNFEQYPGVPIVETFDSSVDILSRGIYDYHLRVGEVKRESLLDKYKFFDLYHMAGILSSVFEHDVEFTTDMDIMDLADLIILMIDELKIDPRHVITPIGIQRIYNFEVGEVILNLHKNDPTNSESLYLAASHAGIAITVESIGLLEDGTEITRQDTKPQFVILEELTLQYMSPQFYSGVEVHREWMSSVKSFRTLDGTHILEYEEGDIVFYGIGDGLSSYRIFTIKELSDVFTMTKSFYDPYSIKAFPQDPLKWSKFSTQSMKRFLAIVMPRLRQKSKSRNSIAYDLLEKSIIDVFENLDHAQEKSKQDGIILHLQKNIEDIRQPLGEFLAYMFNLGVQLSDWDTYMTQIDQNSINVGILSDPNWKYVDPETTVNLTDKLFKMIIMQTEKYINVMGPTDTDYGPSIKSLRMIKHYGDAFRIDWDDELCTIGGYLYSTVEASNLSYYKYLKTLGNWLIVTSQYYSEIILGLRPADISETLIDDLADPDSF